MKAQARKHGKTSRIYVDQHYGPRTQWRRDVALAARKELKAAGTIEEGWVKYPAKLMVKHNKHDEHYKLHRDFSKDPVPQRADKEDDQAA